jgi:hypothetical protein
MAFENPVVAGEGGILIRESIQSPDFVAGVSGWIIRRDGSAEFNDITARGRIEVGPTNGPQVVIDSTPFAGFIEFPSNAAFEADSATIRAQSNEADPVVGLDLRIESATTVNSTDQAYIELSSESQDQATPARLEMGVSGASSNMVLSAAGLEINGALTTTDAEIFVDDNSSNGNYPLRVSRGRVNGGANTTTLGVNTDTALTNTSSTSAILENSIAYRVDVQLQTRSSVGTSAAGTQAFAWKLWDGAIGGAQLGPTIETWNTSVGNNLDTIQFSFLFQYTGVTGSKTVMVSGSDVGGTDTLQVVSNTRYFMLINRVGRPSNILNL